MKTISDNFDQDQWITTAEAAALTGYTAAYFRQLIAEGRLPARKRGRDWFLFKTDVLAYLEEMSHLGAAKYDPWRTGSRRKRVIS